MDEGKTLWISYGFAEAMSQNINEQVVIAWEKRIGARYTQEQKGEILGAWITGDVELVVNLYDVVGATP